MRFAIFRTGDIRNLGTPMMTVEKQGLEEELS
jgi:hypothetical protein